MLDVHPAHHAASTWRDFFIHIATIVIGLFIAVGLEQTVEAIHHANERRELIAEMRDQAQLNVPIAHRDIDVLLAQAEWFIAAAHAIEQTQPVHGTVSLTLPPHAPFDHNIPVYRAVWPLALSNGRAALLADSQAKVYERLERMNDRVDTAIERRNSFVFAQQREQLRLHITIVPGARIAFPQTEMPSILGVLADRAASLRSEARWDAVIEAYNGAVANNIFDLSQAMASSDAESAAFDKRIATPN